MDTKSHHENPQTGRPPLDCRQAVEVLPWLVNGTLEAEERRAVVDHLAGCESCRRELGDTVRVFQLTSCHVPSLDLAEVAQGLEPSTLDRATIESHLALCPSCREELALMSSGAEVVDFPAARAPGRPARPGPAHERTCLTRPPAPRRRPAYRRLALAASVAAALAAGTLLWTTGRHSEPLRERVARTSAPSSEPRPDESPFVFADGFESGTTKTWNSASYVDWGTGVDN